MSLRQLQKQRQKLADRIENDKRDLQALDRVIEMWQREKPDHVQSGEPESNERSEPTSESVSPIPAPVETNGTIHLPLAGMVRVAISALGEKFTKTDVAGTIRRTHPNVTVKDQDVSSLMWRMEERGELILVERGGGGKPSIYKRGTPKPSILGRAIQRMTEMDKR